MERRGIIVAGGSGSRLDPLTEGVSKHLLPVYNKPMIYYPLTVLMLAGIRDIRVVCNPCELAAFERVLGDGEQWGVSLDYATQPEPRGVADALLQAKEFADGAPLALILGDNVFYGNELKHILRRVGRDTTISTVFAYPVSTPERYGVIDFDEAGGIRDIVEKPDEPPSRYAVPGLYFYDGTAAEHAESLEPSERGELEITALNRRYLEEGGLQVEVFGRGVAWFDAGTPDALLQASNFVQMVERRQGTMIGSPEEVAFNSGYIDAERLRSLAGAHRSEYRQYLLELVDGRALYTD